jgi:hypothetical protein
MIIWVFLIDYLMNYLTNYLIDYLIDDLFDYLLDYLIDYLNRSIVIWMIPIIIWFLFEQLFENYCNYLKRVK